MTDERHSAFGAARTRQINAIRYSYEELDTLEKLAKIMPNFIDRRYRFIGVNPGYVALMPVEPAETPEDADKLHADVMKLFNHLVALAVKDGAAVNDQRVPKRRVMYNGTVQYTFAISGLADFVGVKYPVTFSIEGLQAGSKCTIEKVVKGTREVEDFEYVMHCEDEEGA